MHMEKGLCSPEQLHTLQTIFDDVWMEVQANGGHNGPDDAETIRTEIARRVISHAESDLSRGEIISAILKSVGIELRRPNLHSLKFSRLRTEPSRTD